ncbi:MAG: hypothetical protein OZ928_20425 [Polyangiaceae bacterium]|nr:hypothetical protein [Polyangiaceae bacterium]
MNTPWRLPWLAALMVACGGSGTSGMAGGGASGTDGGGGTGAGTADGGGGDGATPSDGSTTDAGGPTAHCSAYIACTAATTPAGLGAVIATYGNDGTCYAAAEASLCDDACKTGLVAAHRAFPSVGACNYCATSADCPAALPACDVSVETCVGCVTSADCHDADLPVCDAAEQRCVRCLEDSDCTSGDGRACAPGGDRCVECTKDEHCASPTPRCDLTSNACVGCMLDADCASSPSGHKCLPLLKRCGCGPLGGGCNAGQLCEGGQCCTPDCAGRQCGKSNSLGCGGDDQYACGSCPGGGTCTSSGSCNDLGATCTPATSQCYAGEACRFLPSKQGYVCLVDASGDACSNQYQCAVTARVSDSFECRAGTCRAFCLTPADCASGKCEAGAVPISPSSPGVCSAP